MRTGMKVQVSTADRIQMDAIVADRNTPQKHVWRAQIVLLTAGGCGTAEIMRDAGVSKTAVWRWQERFMTDGVAGLLRDKTRPSRIPPLEAQTVVRVVAATQTDPPRETTHCTASPMAKAQDIGVSWVQRIWRRHGLPSGGIFRCRPGSTEATAVRSPEAASLRARSIPDSQYRQDLLAGRSLSDRCSGNGHHPPSQSIATPIVSPFPLGYRPDRSYLPYRHTPILSPLPQHAN
jgi:transposase